MMVASPSTTASTSQTPSSKSTPPKGPTLIAGDLDTDLRSEQLHVLSEGVTDAVVLAFFGHARGEGKEAKSELAGETGEEIAWSLRGFR